MSNMTMSLDFTVDYPVPEATPAGELGFDHTRLGAAQGIAFGLMLALPIWVLSGLRVYVAL